MLTRSKTAKTAGAKRPSRSEKLDLRLSPRDKSILRQAAELDRRSVADFVLSAAIERAEDMLPDRRLFKLNAEQWTALMAALDAPPNRHPRLERLLREPSQFDDVKKP